MEMCYNKMAFQTRQSVHIIVDVRFSGVSAMQGSTVNRRLSGKSQEH